MIFVKNKKYFSSLRNTEEGRWECDNPLWISKDKGLFPVYKTSGRQGVLNKNHHELILKDLKEKNDDIGDRI